MGWRKSRAGGPVPVGYGGAVAGERIVAVAKPDAAPIHRALRSAQQSGKLIDLTAGRQTRAVVFMDTGHIIRVAIAPETLLVRWSGEDECEEETYAGTAGAAAVPNPDRAV